YPIPGNDDAIRANSLFARVIADAVAEGRFIAQKRNPAPEPAVEKSPEELAEFEVAQKAARDAAAQAQADRDARLNAVKDELVGEAAAKDSDPAEPAAEAPDAPDAATTEIQES
ncbi:MAG: 30S ribosomal protein S2, partial [Ilumatobacter sp.]|nr:30S ribosomal protein S2 [Ilumatobacter sp.]